MAIDEDEVARLEDRLHAARRDLRAAYERRDALAAEVDDVRKAGRLAGRPSLLVALSLAERDLDAAQTALKDAAYVLAERTGTDLDAQLGSDP